MIAATLSRWWDTIVKRGLEAGSTTPWLARGLTAPGLPVVVTDARRASAALKARPVKTDRAGALALAEMLRSGRSRGGFRQVRREPAAEGAAAVAGPAGRR